MQHSINQVNYAPKPKVLQIMGYWFYYILLLLSVFTFTVAIIFNSEIGKLLSMVGFGISFIAILFPRKTIKDSNAPAQIADGEYYKARYAYEMYARQVETLYGDDSEAKPILNKFAAAIKRFKRERYQNRKKVTMVICSISLIILSICAFFGSKKDPIKLYKQPVSTDFKSLPDNAFYVLNLSKRLKPYPPTTGVDAGLDTYLIAYKGAELTFVVDKENAPTYHWKINKLELMSTDTIAVDSLYPNNSIKIRLLDKNLNIIELLNESTENFDHKSIIINGKGHYFSDFWSKYSTNSIKRIKSIIQKADYYTIYSN